MKTYTIVAGVNGCGKSSLTGVLRTEIDNLGKIIDVDKITANGDISTDGKLIVKGKDEDGVYSEVDLMISMEDENALINGGRAYFFDATVNAPVFKGDVDADSLEADCNASYQSMSEVEKDSATKEAQINAMIQMMENVGPIEGDTKGRVK